MLSDVVVDADVVVVVGASVETSVEEDEVSLRELDLRELDVVSMLADALLSNVVIVVVDVDVFMLAAVVVVVDTRSTRLATTQENQKQRARTRTKIKWNIDGLHGQSRRWSYSRVRVAPLRSCFRFVGSDHE